jgi:hypothetical protein
MQNPIIKKFLTPTVVHLDEVSLSAVKYKPINATNISLADDPPQQEVGCATFINKKQEILAFRH